MPPQRPRDSGVDLSSKRDLTVGGDVTGRDHITVFGVQPALAILGVISILAVLAMVVVLALVLTSNRAVPAAQSFMPVDPDHRVEVGDPVQITREAGTNQLPAFSPDGNRLVFLSDRDGNREIYIANLDGSAPERLTETPDIYEDVPSFSPDGLRIVFGGVQIGGEHDGDEELYVMNVDGSGRVNLSNSPATRESRPKFSPSGGAIVFDSNRSGDFEIYLAPLDGDRLGTPEPLTIRPEYNDRLPMYDRLGTFIIFRSELIGEGINTSRINRMRPDGSDLQEFSSNYYALYPVISNDSKWILYTSQQDQNFEIYIMSIDAKTIVRLTEHLGDDRYAMLSPNQHWIAFQSMRDSDHFDLYVMPVRLKDP